MHTCRIRAHRGLPELLLTFPTCLQSAAATALQAMSSTELQQVSILISKTSDAFVDVNNKVEAACESKL
jgi:hypothetical protein